MNASPRPPRRSSRRELLATAAALLLAPLGGACSGFVQQLHVVDISDQKGYQPASVSVGTGDTVRWKNYGIYPHTVTDDPSGTAGSSGAAGASAAANQSLPSGAPAFDSGDILPGRTWSYTFKVPGQYQYTSTDDQGQPFQGTISVS
jgi:plastocyanin